MTPWPAQTLTHALQMALQAMERVMMWTMLGPQCVCSEFLKSHVSVVSVDAFIVMTSTKGHGQKVWCAHCGASGARFYEVSRVVSVRVRSGALLQCGSAARESRLERRPDAAEVTHMKHNNVGWRCWEESD